MRICRIATVPFFLLCHLKGQIMATIKAGYDVTLISSQGPEVDELLRIHGIHFHAIDIPRQTFPLRDLKALFALYRYFRKERFRIVHSNTPKAGLLCAVSAFLARVPIRIHTFTGIPWDELSFIGRVILAFCYNLIIYLNAQCYTDSESQRQLLISKKMFGANDLKVLGAGSLAGVDLSRFNTNNFPRKTNIKAELLIPSNGKVITYIGRLVNEKGIVELISAFEILLKNGNQDSFLILVGPFEPERAPLHRDTIEKIMNNSNIRQVGFSLMPEKYLAISDLFCLPSYREGFGNVVIEAAAMGVPSVATSVVGIIDAVVDGITGILVPPKDIDGLANALSTLLRNDKLRHKMGEEAKQRVQKLYDMDVVNSYILKEYARLSENN